MKQTWTFDDADLSGGLVHKPVQSVSLRTEGLKGKYYVAAIFAGALVSCASSASGAVSVSPARLNATQPHMLIAAREEDTGQELAGWMGELKTRAGLTWGQLGIIFEVSRRTIQTWAAGGAISDERRERVAALVDKVRSLSDDLRAFEVRDRLFGSREGAVSDRDAIPAEAPILFSDNQPLARNLAVTRQGKTRIKRS